MRWLLTILAAISLVLFALTVFFFARSYGRFDGVLHFGVGHPGTATGVNEAGLTESDQIRPRSSGLISYRGQLTYVSIVNPIGGDTWEGWSVPVDRPYAAGPMNIVWDVREKHGVGWGESKTHSGLMDPIHHIMWQLSYDFVTAPYWLLAVLFGILPTRWFMNYRQTARREREGKCVKCGRDLKGATEGKCPTCGAPVEA
jgi:hypothetical protein